MAAVGQRRVTSRGWWHGEEDATARHRRTTMVAVERWHVTRQRRTRGVTVERGRTVACGDDGVAVRTRPRAPGKDGAAWRDVGAWQDGGFRPDSGTRR